MTKQLRLALAALTLTGLLGGCVAYPASPGYGYAYAPSYAYAPAVETPGYVVLGGGGWHDGWRDGGWHGGGWREGGHGGGWHGGGWHGGGWRH